MRQRPESISRIVDPQASGTADSRSRRFLRLTFPFFLLMLGGRGRGGGLQPLSMVPWLLASIQDSRSGAGSGQGPYPIVLLSRGVIPRRRLAWIGDYLPSPSLCRIDDLILYMAPRTRIDPCGVGFWDTRHQICRTLLGCQSSWSDQSTSFVWQREYPGSRCLYLQVVGFYPFACEGHRGF